VHRITEANRHVDKFGTGKDGFRDGDKAAGVTATRPGAVTFDVQQEELANVVTAAGLTLSVAGGDYTQLTNAIKRLAGGMLRGARTGTCSRTSNAVITLAPESSDKIAIEIDGVLREAASLTWDNTADMDTGSVAANTVYYLYALVTADALAKKISATAPSTTGKVGYHPTRTSERCIFAMRTKAGSAVWADFDEMPDGWTVLRAPDTLEFSPGLTMPATYTSLTLTGVPATARAVRITAHTRHDDAQHHYAHEALSGATVATNKSATRLGAIDVTSDTLTDSNTFDIPCDSTPTIVWAVIQFLGSSPGVIKHEVIVGGWRNSL
jgi:hypothetical protein